VKPNSSASIAEIRVAMDFTDALLALSQEANMEFSWSTHSGIEEMAFIHPLNAAISEKDWLGLYASKSQLPIEFGISHLVLSHLARAIQLIVSVHEDEFPDDLDQDQFEDLREFEID